MEGVKIVKIYCLLFVRRDNDNMAMFVYCLNLLESKKNALNDIEWILFIFYQWCAFYLFYNKYKISSGSKQWIITEMLARRMLEYTKVLSIFNVFLYKLKRNQRLGVILNVLLSSFTCHLSSM